jgi:Rrf2 family iron-sulfur cluster assembly transcriptional regulator
LKLTRGTDYGIQGILHLATRPCDRVTLLHDIAKSCEIPETYLAKIFQDLTKAGLVRSHRGAKGGFCLARPASDITLRQVIEALQGPISLNRCLDVTDVCGKADTCPVAEVLRKAQAQLLATLDEATLEGLAQQSLATRGEGQSQAA